MKTDWKLIKESYQTGGLIYQELAAMFGIPVATIEARAGSEKWKPPSFELADEFPKNLKKENSTPPPLCRRGRKKVLTPERVQIIHKAIATGSSEKAARLKAGIGVATFYQAKKSDPSFAQAVEKAHQEWAQLRYDRHQAALYESQWLRRGRQKLGRPEPLPPAKLVSWYLVARVPLNIATIGPKELKDACDLYNLPLDQWNRQNDAFGLMTKVYAKRAKLRGENPRSSIPPEFRQIRAQASIINPTYGVK